MVDNDSKTTTRSLNRSPTPDCFLGAYLGHGLGRKEGDLLQTFPKSSTNGCINDVISAIEFKKTSKNEARRVAKSIPKSFWKCIMLEKIVSIIAFVTIYELITSFVAVFLRFSLKSKCFQCISFDAFRQISKHGNMHLDSYFTI